MARAGALRRVAARAAHPGTGTGILVRVPRNTASADVCETCASRVPASNVAGSFYRIPGCVVGGEGRILDRIRGIVNIIVYRCGPPVDPIRGEVRLAQVHVFCKRNDRDIDVAVCRGSTVQLVDQCLGRGLEGSHLARAVHRPSIVEHERDAQPGNTPLGGGRSSHVKCVESEHPHELRIKRSRGLDLDVGTASRAVEHLDIDVLGFLAREERVEIFRRIFLELLFGELSCGFGVAGEREWIVILCLLAGSAVCMAALTELARL